MSGACANSCLLGRPRSTSPGSGGCGPGRRAPGSTSARPRSAGSHGPGLASRASPSPPARPPGRVSAPRTPGPQPAPRAWAGAAPRRPGPARSPAGRSPWRPPGAAATRRATLGARGSRGRYYLRAPRRLLRLLRGTRGFMSSGHGGVLPGPPPPPALPSFLPPRLSGSSLLPQVHGVAPRYLIILRLLSPAPAELLRLGHRFPVGHGAGSAASERTRRIGSLSATIRGEREESRARGGQGRDVGRRLQVCERAECDCVGSPGATSPTGALPTVRRAAARAPFKGVGGAGRGGVGPTAAAGFHARILSP